MTREQALQRIEVLRGEILEFSVEVALCGGGDDGFWDNGGIGREGELLDAVRELWKEFPDLEQDLEPPWEVIEARLPPRRR